MVTFIVCQPGDLKVAAEPLLCLRLSSEPRGPDSPQVHGPSPQGVACAYCHLCSGQGKETMQCTHRAKGVFVVATILASAV